MPMRGRGVIALLNMALVAIDFGARAQGYVEHREALWCRTCIADEVAVQHLLRRILQIRSIQSGFSSCATRRRRGHLRRPQTHTHEHGEVGASRKHPLRSSHTRAVLKPARSARRWPVS